MAAPNSLKNQFVGSSTSGAPGNRVGCSMKNIPNKNYVTSKIQSLGLHNSLGVVGGSWGFPEADFTDCKLLRVAPRLFRQ